MSLDLIGGLVLGIGGTLVCTELGATVAQLAYERWQRSRWAQPPTRIEALRHLLESSK
jgi:hypothetical protein